MKKINFLVFIMISLTTANAQKIRYGVYAGVGFTQEKSDMFNISTLPVGKGGMNFHYAVFVNMKVAKRFELETGLQKVTKGFTYTTTTGFPTSQYDKITTISLPLMVIGHVIDNPQDVPFRLSVGVGAYASYAVSGKIIEEDGSSTSAKFSNSKRFEFGPKWILKFEYLDKYQVYFSDDIRATNIIKNGSGYVKEGSLQMGFGYKFGRK